MTRRDRAICMGVGLVAAALAAVPVLRAQSLSELAGLEKARRVREEQVYPRSAAVVRTEDLARYGRYPGLLPVSFGQAADASATDGAEADKAYWALELDAARSAFARAESLAADANGALRAAREQPLPETYTEALEAMDAREALKAAADEANSEAQGAREALAEVEAEARGAAAE